MDNFDISKLAEMFPEIIEFVNSGYELPAEFLNVLARLLDTFPGLDLPSEIITLVNTRHAKAAIVSPAQNNANTINELVAELINLENADSGFEICVELISNTINELFAELMNLAGIETTSSDLTSTIQERVTELVNLKRGRVGSEPNLEANLALMAESIDKIIASFIETNKNGIEFQSIKRMTNAELVSLYK